MGYGAEPALTQPDAPAVLYLATFFELTPLAEAVSRAPFARRRRDAGATLTDTWLRCTLC